MIELTPSLLAPALPGMPFPGVEPGGGSDSAPVFDGLLIELLGPPDEALPIRSLPGPRQDVAAGGKDLPLAPGDRAVALPTPIDDVDDGADAAEPPAPVTATLSLAPAPDADPRQEPALAWLMPPQPMPAASRPNLPRPVAAERRTRDAAAAPGPNAAAAEGAPKPEPRPGAIGRLYASAATVLTPAPAVAVPGPAIVQLRDDAAAAERTGDTLPPMAAGTPITPVVSTNGAGPNVSPPVVADALATGVARPVLPVAVPDGCARTADAPSRRAVAAAEGPIVPAADPPLDIGDRVKPSDGTRELGRDRDSGPASTPAPDVPPSALPVALNAPIAVASGTNTPVDPSAWAPVRTTPPVPLAATTASVPTPRDPIAGLPARQWVEAATREPMPHRMPEVPAVPWQPASMSGASASGTTIPTSTTPAATPAPPATVTPIIADPANAGTPSAEAAQETAVASPVPPVVRPLPDFAIRLATAPALVVPIAAENAVVAPGPATLPPRVASRAVPRDGDGLPANSAAHSDRPAMFAPVAPPSAETAPRDEHALPARPLAFELAAQSAPAGSPTVPLAAAQPIDAAALPKTGIDLTHAAGLHRVIDHIEALRDSAPIDLGAASTRIRLIPDALGPVDVAVRRDGDAVQVHFTASEAATRQLITDAQPRLAEIAEARGVRIARATVDGGTASQPSTQFSQHAQGNAHGQGHAQPQRHPVANPATLFRARAGAATEPKPTEHRIA